MSVVEIVATRTKAPSYTFTSHPGGTSQPPDPGALQIEFDLPKVANHRPQGNTYIRVSGVGLQMISQAANLNPVDGVATTNFKLYGGMGKGLPLANPAQAGLLVQGQVFQAYGNWTGTEQTLELICNPGIVPGSASPNNTLYAQGMGIMLDWKPGQSLAAALAISLTQAYPQYEQKINIANLFITNGVPQQACYGSLTSFSSWLHEFTKTLGAQVTGNPQYPGVSIWITGNTINVGDNTKPATPNVVNNAKSTQPKQLAFQDLIGQPVWIGPTTISFSTVLRADLDVNDQVKFPDGVIAPYVLTSPNAAKPNVPARSKSAFQGLFKLLEVHHYANFRQPDSAAWNTTYTAAYVRPTTPNLLTAGAAL
jgi:hypothetical protein